MYRNAEFKQVVELHQARLKQARLKNVASRARPATAYRVEGSAVLVNPDLTERSGFNGSEAARSLPVTQLFPEDERNEPVEARSSVEATEVNPDIVSTQLSARVRSDVFVQQASPVAERAADVARAYRTEPAPASVEKAEEAWDVLIPEALQERRFAIALRPIEELACGSKLYEAMPRLLDCDGHEIEAEAFYGPASQLGLVDNIERRLVGYAFLAQLRLQHEGESAWMLIPLSASALDDQNLFALLRSLASHPGARLAMDSLVIEFDQRDIEDRIKDVERMARELGRFGCNLGIRGFTATRAAEQLLDRLHVATVRLAPDILERIEANEGLRTSLQIVTQRCAKTGVVAIASAVPNAEAMAMLYNLGVGAVEGPAIGLPRLYQAPRNSKVVN